MGYFMRPAGGGSSNDLTFPTDPITLADVDGRLSLLLTNPGGTSGSVEASFSAANLVGVDFDHGTAATPSWVVDPDTGSRTIYFQRSPIGSGSGACTVQLTSNAGTIGSFDATIEAPAICAVVAGVATPTIEYRCDTLTNTGSIGSSWNLTASGASAAASTSVTGVTGAISIAADTDHCITGSILRDPYLRISGQARTWIWIFAAKSTGVTEYYYSGYTGGVATYIPGLIYQASHPQMYYDGGSVWNFDTTHDHSGGGSSETLDFVGAGLDDKVAVIAMSHAGDGTGTTRWKQDGQASGFSYNAWTGHTYNTTSTGTNDFFGRSVNDFNAYPIDHYYFGVIDAVLTDANFTSILTVLGLNN